MDRRTAHVARHRISGTELIVVTDLAEGADADAVGEVERRVIGRYAAEATWMHREVTLFVLDGLEPLVRQLHAHPDVPAPLARALPVRYQVEVRHG